jgi:hypothetical protein
METIGARAKLFIKGQHVGDVCVQGLDSSWGYGEFTPNNCFSEFAPLFGTWSLLMHADEASAVMSQAASEELRKIETALDALKAELHWYESEKVLAVTQLNIDGNLIEWKRD